MRGGGILPVVGLIDVSTRVGWPVYAGLALLCGWLVWILIAPDYWWRVERSFVGWQYRDGHRIELSTAGRVAARIGAVVTILGMLGGAAATVDWTAARRVRTEWLRPANTVYYVGDPVRSPGCVVRVFVCLRSEKVFPIDVQEYRADHRPSDLEKLPDDTNLLLYVERRFFPTHVVVDEGDRVTVTLYGKCARTGSGGAYGRSTSDCPQQPPPALDDRSVVPVTLSSPLGHRLLVDGARDTPVTPHR